MTYWEDHYRGGGNSGPGSRGQFAAWKADMVNRAIGRYGVTSILELGSGDGYMAAMYHVEDYLGLDPSPAAVELARKAAPQHRFEVYPDTIEPRQAHLSLDVIRHLMEPATYRRHLVHLFSAREVVMVWSSDVEQWWSANELEHHWTPDIPEGWSIVHQEPVPTINSNFYVLTR